MTYDLALGDYAYSSWSMRIWLLFDRTGLPRKLHFADFTKDATVADQIPQLAPAKTVPSLRTPEGAILSETTAIAEELATRHPEAGFWPVDPLARATARNLTEEMHSGFAALRGFCPMNLRLAYTGVNAPPDVDADLRRLEKIWAHARSVTGSQTPWLCGEYSIADAFYAPVAARIAGYGLNVSEEAQAYVGAHLADGGFRRWRAMGMVKGGTVEDYKRDYEVVDWPGPQIKPAQAVEEGPSVNSICPYSGEPATHFMQTGSKVFGFCNAFCRDKTVADQEAWPAFVNLLSSVR
ncbi:MAG: glutathione S-transferase [Pseudomonadota bacterium]